MRILVIVQDLRISGTSEGIVSRSFLTKLRKTYPHSRIDVVYLKNHQNNDSLEHLPVDTIEQHYIPYKIPAAVIWINKFYWRAFGKNLKDRFLIQKYRNVIKKLKFQEYEHIFVRSSGQGFEGILALKGLPILKKSIINFHDPYPVLWDTGNRWDISNTEVNKLKMMWSIVSQAKRCITPAVLLSHDMQHLYGTTRKFFTLPHQYDKDAFPASGRGKMREKKKQVTISYHGAVQLGRNMDILLDAYLELLEAKPAYLEKTEVILRIRGNHTDRLRTKYEHPNIEILDTLDFCGSAAEQKLGTDILLVLENCAPHSNILVGKAPFLASLNKPILSLSPLRSEMRNIIQGDKYIANCQDRQEIKVKLESLIVDCLQNNNSATPFGDYFAEERFRHNLDPILVEN